MAEAERLSVATLNQALVRSIALAVVRETTQTHQQTLRLQQQLQVMAAVCGRDQRGVAVRCSTHAPLEPPLDAGVGQSGGGGGRGGRCQQCLELIFTCDDLLAPQTQPLVAQARRTTCAGLCFCDIEAFQRATVNFPSSATIEDFTAAQVDSVVRQVQADIVARYAQTPPANSIRAILRGDACQESVEGLCNERVSAQIRNSINQLVATSQIVSLQGIGSIRNVTTEMLVDAVMNAVIRSSSQMTQQSVHETLASIREEVSRAFAVNAAWVWNRYFAYWVTLAVILGVAVLTLLAVHLWRAYGLDFMTKRRKAKNARVSV